MAVNKSFCRVFDLTDSKHRDSNIWNTIYLSSNNVKPLLGTYTYAHQAAGILVKLEINHYTTTKKKGKNTG